MFFFKRRQQKELDLSWLQADMHSHLLPGIDDGSPDLAVSLELIRGLAQFGYKKLITTPHVLWEVYPNTSEIIQQKLGEVKTALQKEQVAIDFHAAAEYFLDDNFEERLQNKVPLLTLAENLVLVEFSMITAPFELQQVLFELQIQNYQPVLAHPERYVYLDGRREFFDQLKDAGCLFQVNLLSLTGYYGSAVQELAQYLLDGGYYNLAGTDLHHPKHLSALQKLAGSDALEQLKDAPLLNSRL